MRLLRNKLRNFILSFGNVIVKNIDTNRTIEANIKIKILKNKI